MSSSQKPIKNRVIFFDNLRFFLVVCVVLQHSSNAYTNLTWWPVADKAISIVAHGLQSFIDAFAMPLLFYIAGYFAVPTIVKKGGSTFFKGKLRRLGIPWVICILVVCPIVPLVFHYTRDTLAMSYWNLWVDLFRNAAEFNFGIIYSLNELMRNNQFYQRYMWFLSLLILFFFVFGAIYSVKRSWFKEHDQPISPETPSVLSTLKTLFTVGGLTFICSSIAVGSMLSLAPKLSNPEPFFTLGNVIQFRPSRIFLFIIYFTLGILTFKNKWIERGKFPGHFRTWLISFGIILIAFFIARHLMLHGPEDLEEMFGLVFFFFLNFLTISTLGLCASLALKYWNRPTVVNQNLSSNSYNMYLAHYPFVIGLQLILFEVSGRAGLLKFAIVSFFSILFTYIFCQFVLKPFPRFSAVLAIGLLVMMLLFIHP